jgi:hypothetical protein
MSLANMIVMPTDNCINPFIIPGTARKYSCAIGASISVVGEDALVLITNGWIASAGGIHLGSYPTASRPANPLVGQRINDSTLGVDLLFAGKKTGWLHHSTGVVS